MDAKTASDLAKKLQISINYVIREEYEMMLLKELFDSEFGKYLVFKGGTALRLVYGSPRFSEDLDFTAIGDFNINEFISFLKKLSRLPGVEEVEARKKHYTAFALVKIKDPILPRPTSIKIEVSMRKGEWVKDKDYSDKPIASEVTVFRVIIRVASLEKILEEKENALKNRQAPRDRFDYWFIKQLLGKNISLDFSGINPEQVKSELHRLLPKSQWRLVES